MIIKCKALLNYKGVITKLCSNAKQAILAWSSMELFMIFGLNEITSH
jgi:hypothetical protein